MWLISTNLTSSNSDLYFFKMSWFHLFSFIAVWKSLVYMDYIFKICSHVNKHGGQLHFLSIVTNMGIQIVCGILTYMSRGIYTQERCSWVIQYFKFWLFGDVTLLIYIIDSQIDIPSSRESACLSPLILTNICCHLYSS